MLAYIINRTDVARCCTTYDAHYMDSTTDSGAHCCADTPTRARPNLQLPTTTAATTAATGQVCCRRPGEAAPEAETEVETEADAEADAEAEIEADVEDGGNARRPQQPQKVSEQVTAHMAHDGEQCDEFDAARRRLVDRLRAVTEDVVTLKADVAQSKTDADARVAALRARIDKLPLPASK